jgi:hypothetical protein
MPPPGAAVTTALEARNANDELFARLSRVTDKRRIATFIVSRKGPEIINLIIGHAKAGLGEEDAAYPPYSPKYDKRKAKAGGGQFLRGIGKTGRSGGMLDPKNFSFEVTADGVLYLVWTAADARMAIYGQVHNDGLPLGKGGPSKKRPWMHLKWERARAAIDRMVRDVLVILADEFKNGN